MLRRWLWSDKSLVRYRINVFVTWSDFTAVDHEGNIVLIEIKRDRKDIENRREAFEFQAIRYAAIYATIWDYEDLVNKVYAPYIEKYRHEFGNSELTSTEIATRKIVEFLDESDVLNNFNHKQRIVLVASDLTNKHYLRLLC